MNSKLIALLSAAPLLAAAQSNPITQRYTYSYIDPGAGGMFSAATMVYNNSLSIESGFTGDAFYGVSALPLATNIVFYAGNGATADPGSAPDGTPFTNLKITGNGGNEQFWGFDYNIAASPLAGQSFLQQDVVAGKYVLRFSGGGFGLVPVGARFFSSVVIQGDWSAPASHSPVLFGGGYNLIQDFEYNGIVTRFTIDTANYDGTNPSISFYLIGAPVPEPGAWALMLMGLGGLIALSLRQRRPGKAPQD